MSLAAQDAIWLRRLLNSLEIKQSLPTKLYEDNQEQLRCPRTLTITQEQRT